VLLILTGKPTGNRPLGIDGRTMLEWTSKNEMILLRIGIIGETL
jgi:hypothetical protein